jgi:DNA (cytosine-5)-methyltransferase 1
VQHFFRLVAGLRPKFFLMENVRGLGFGRNGRVLEEGLDLVRGNYKLLGPKLLDSADFGAATKRPRLFVMGFNTDRMPQVTANDLEAEKREPATVMDAICDLQDAAFESTDNEGFDLWRHDTKAVISSYAAFSRRNSRLFTGHRRTVHAKETIDRFAAVTPGQRDAVGKHPRLEWAGQCPTLRAGTGSERGSYQSVRPIRPSEARVITVREAARLQGFPDDFIFHPTIWHSFRMIGNSVSPILAKTLFSIIASRLASAAA